MHRFRRWAAAALAATVATTLAAAVTPAAGAIEPDPYEPPGSPAPPLLPASP
jgi:hypothetical protein